MSITSLIKAEKLSLSKVHCAEEHKEIMEKWSRVKEIFVLIYKEIPTLGNYSVDIRVDFSKLSIPSEAKESALTWALNENVCTFFGFVDDDIPSRVTVITSESAVRYFNGELRVRDIDSFKGMYRQLLDFCSFISDDGKKRFPQIYSSNSDKKDVLNTVVEVFYNSRMNITKVKIDKFGLLEFKGKRGRIVDFFHSRRRDGLWYKATDLSFVTSNGLEKAVKSMNKRVDKGTVYTIEGIIDIKEKENKVSREPNQYRWKF